MNLQFWNMGHTYEKLKELQNKDEDVGPILRWKISGKKSCDNDMHSNSPATRHYYHLRDSLVFQDGLLFRKFEKQNNTGQYLQLKSEVEIFAIQDQTAATCANHISNDVICRCGCPLSLHSDQGRNFESDIFKELYELLEIRTTRTSSRNPKGNGQCERFNRAVLGMIKSYIKGEPNGTEIWVVLLGHTEPHPMNPLP
ncbi:unnamed protein product [Mytilus coruscus]|uniref:Integrase catalytic domain-containing protein n=1 Tax=Mytilus coruscus TaxID=42192 RepID=A0A6J8AZC8_MYTCO|nr:unnamed protein product [Mytilus coruscus]